MSIEAVVFKTFRKLGADDSDAAAFADELNAAIDKRYTLHAAQLATRGDVDTVRKEMAEMKTELIKAIAESQRWTIIAIFASVGVFAALTKLLQ
jgi:hypothetical protein